MPLSLLLKTQTQPQHDDAEHHPLHAVLFGSQGHARARAAYVRLLAQHLHVQEAFEPRLRSAASGSRSLDALVREHHYHLDALREDLAALGVTPELGIMCPATTRFIAFIELCAAHEGHGLLGVFYVFEGSTNGGTIVAMKIKESLGTGDGEGTRFINPHGPLVRARWAAWKEMLDTIDFDARQRHAIIAAAQETFRLSHAVLDDVHRAMHPDGVTHTPLAVAP
jgi:heme oxygenase